ncbi:MAG: hypothetical protein GWM98_12710, partial [Nitrospinaceae bacterium]|nr:hypothetical protein [Nitrospinaceae bacterium]NIR55185.1 hypothetical protein [Nitrospinaceae bacterium]NIS85609.1 hypothetical protein [Nitrospinaceae bacterium]NIT82455.1 hypothetical protein [Nitrospinaceae bacterium]NIU44668.1 hypothetical protein [Nitrospinaceae bacterium]
VGISEKLAEEASPQQMTFGIEYDTDYFTGVLLIPVPLDIAYNLLSQIERTENYSLNREFRSDLEKELHSLAV